MVIQKKRFFSAFMAALTIALLALPASASSRNHIKKGNSAFLAGSFDQALDEYEKATVDEPESPPIYFNKGTALYMKGEYTKAIELFEKAALKTKDPVFEAQSYYNMGNSSFRESERQRDSDLQKSVKGLETAIGHYQKALRLDPLLKDSAHNIEVARLTMKQILDEIKKQEEEKKKEEQENQQQKGDQQQEEQQEEQQQQGEEEKKEEKEGAAGDEQEQEQEQKGEEQKGEEQKSAVIDEDAHDILNQEQRNRERRDQQQPGGYRAIDKDW